MSTSENTLSGITAGDGEVTLNSVQTITNKTLTSPILNDPTINNAGQTITLPAGPSTLATLAGAETISNKSFDDATTNFVHAVNSKLRIDTSAGGANTTTILAAQQSANRTISLPDANTTLIGVDTTDIMSNKTIASTGLSFANTATGYSPTAFNAHQEGALSLIWTNSGGAITGNATFSVKYRLNGHEVSLYFPPMTMTTTGNGTFSIAASTLPTRLTPSLRAHCHPGVVNVGVNQTNPGLLRVDTDGSLSLFKDNTGASFGTGATTGMIWGETLVYTTN